jgi:cytochrome c556
MRWIYFIVLQAILVLVIIRVVYQHNDKAIIIKTPPKELAQWYKPENKRQVWLHNMFKLRREMQAVAFYAERKDQKSLTKWATALGEHYFKIGEMAPSWRNKIARSTLTSIQDHAANENYAGVLTEVNNLQKNCDSCHSDYQEITALTYRAPDFSLIDIEPLLPFNSHMKTLIRQINQIKIASEDGKVDLAISSLIKLKQDMHKLGKVCVDCHKQDKKTYPSEEMNNTLLSLENSLKTGPLKEQNMNIGTLAVQACARCHGTHRLIYGAKNLLSKEQSLSELLTH